MYNAIVRYGGIQLGLFDRWRHIRQQPATRRPGAVTVFGLVCSTVWKVLCVRPFGTSETSDVSLVIARCHKSTRGHAYGGVVGVVGGAGGSASSRGFRLRCSASVGWSEYFGRNCNES
ncbi:hypothetical protein BS78_10G083400 [Paspalum vaginatum]|nr:hypothetical protein BS78_10G083400 [Paspalum vaginatum]